MRALTHYDLGDGITQIDVDLYRPSLASCYLIEQGNKVAFVDTGTYHAVNRLLELLRQRGLTAKNVAYIIPTHVHLDHAGGVGELMERCPNARLVVHPKGAPHMIDPAKLTAGATAVYGEEAFSRDFGVLKPVDADRVIEAVDGLQLDMNERRLICVDSPGHANHHICVFDEQSRQFFTGDTFGLSYREFDSERGPYLFTTTTPVAFDPDAWMNTLDRLMSYQPKAMLLTHFGRVADVGKMADVLRQSIRDHVQIALDEEQGAKEGREERIKAKLLQMLLDGAKRHNSPVSEQTARTMLDMDAGLNAQGLEVWLRRREKNRA